MRDTPSRLRGFAYGLTIDSSISLPSPLVAEGARHTGGDVSVVEGPPDLLREVPPTALGHRFAEGRAALACGDGLFISVDEGARIVVPNGTAIAHFQTSLIGPVLGTVVIQRGWLALHASALVVGEVAVAVCAPSGGGKSVTAAACFLQGDPLVSDDVLAFPFGGASAEFVVPAYPSVRLWPEGAKALGLDPESLEAIDPDLGKLLLDAGDGFSRDPRRLGAIVILESSRSSGTSPRELTGGEAVAALVEHSYGLSALRQAGDLARHFEQVAELVRRVPVARLDVPVASPPSSVADLVRGLGSDLVGAGVR